MNFTPAAQDELDQKLIDLFSEKIRKLMDFKAIVDDCIQRLTAVIETLSHLDPKRHMISDVLLWEIIRTMDKLVILNEVKGRKESPSNELTHYSRFAFLCLQIRIVFYLY